MGQNAIQEGNEVTNLKFVQLILNIRRSAKLSHQVPNRLDLLGRAHAGPFSNSSHCAEVASHSVSQPGHLAHFRNKVNDPGIATPAVLVL